MHETNPDVDREFEAVYEQARLSQNASLKKSLGKEQMKADVPHGSYRKSSKRGRPNRERQDRLRTYNPPMVPVPESKPPAAEYPKKRARPDNNDTAWTSFEPTQKKDLKPIRAPAREAFDRFSAKSASSKQNETLSQAGESEQSEGMGLLAKFKRDKLKTLPAEPVSKAPEQAR